MAAAKSIGAKEVPRDIKQNLRAVLISSNKAGVLMGNLLHEYKQLTGNILPWRDLGYKDLFSFLLAVPDVARMEFREAEEDNRVFAVIDNASFTSNHAKKMAARGFGKGTKPLSPQQIKEFKQKKSLEMTVSKPGIMGAAPGLVDGSKLLPFLSSKTKRRGHQKMNNLSIKGYHVNGNENAVDPSLASALESFSYDCQGLYSVYVFRRDQRNFSDITETDMIQFFGSFGPVSQVKVWPDKCYAFVKYPDKISAVNAVCNGGTIPLKGTVFSCRPAKQRTKAERTANKSSTPQKPMMKPGKLYGDDVKESLKVSEHSEDVSSTVDPVPSERHTGVNGEVGDSLPDEEPLQDSTGDKFSNAKRRDIVQDISLADRFVENDRGTLSEGVSDNGIRELIKDKQMAVDDQEERGSDSNNELLDILNNIGTRLEPKKETPDSITCIKEKEQLIDVSEKQQHVSYTVPKCLEGFQISETDFTHLYGLACSEKPKTAAQLPDYIKFLVHSVVDSSKMWIHVYDTEEYRKLKRIESLLQNICVSRVPPKQGHIGAGKYGIRDWYRCWIRTLLSETNQLEVFYLDYGNVETIQMDEFSYISSDFWDLPPQAIPVKFKGFVPVEGTINEGASFLALLANEKVFKARVEKDVLSKESYAIELTDIKEEYSKDDKTLDELMLTKGYLQPTTAHVYQSLTLQNAGDNLYGPRDDAMTIGQVTEICSMHLFYVVLTAHSSYKELIELKKSFIPKDKPPLEQLQGLMVCVVEETKEVQRAKVVEVAVNFKKSQKVKVFYVDTGKSGWANYSDLFEPSPELESLHLQARPCGLAGITAKLGTQHTKHFLENRVKGKNVSLHVLAEAMDGKILVELFIEGETRSVNRKLIDEDLCKLSYATLNADEQTRPENQYGRSMQQRKDRIDASVESSSSSATSKESMASRILKSAGAPTSSCHRSSLQLRENNITKFDDDKTGGSVKTPLTPPGSPSASEHTSVSDIDELKEGAVTGVAYGADKFDQFSMSSTSSGNSSTLSAMEDRRLTSDTINRSSEAEDSKLTFSDDTSSTHSSNNLSACLSALELTDESWKEEQMALTSYIEQLTHLLDKPSDVVKAFFLEKKKKKLALRVRIKKLEQELAAYKTELMELETERDDLLSQA